MKKIKLITVALSAMIILCFLFSSISLAAEPKTTKKDGKKETPSLVVMPLKPIQVDKELARTLTEVLCSYLGKKKPQYNVLCESDIKALLESADTKAMLGTCKDDNCHGFFEKAVCNPIVLGGTIAKYDGTYEITLKITTRTLDQTLKWATKEIKAKENKLIPLLKETVDKLIK